MKRVMVYLSKDNQLAQPARFQQSVVGHFCGRQEDSRMVSCGLDQNRFLISDREFPGSNRVLLQRPSFCPIKHLSEEQAGSLPKETRDRGVDVGVAVILQSVNLKVLLTRRSRNLSIFPNVWVPPGGHIEPGEQVLEAGLRELREETGLTLQEGGFSWRMLALWESAFPPLLSRGLPTRHHIVIYLLLNLRKSHQELQMRPEEAEVSAFTWMGPQVLAAVAATQDESGVARMLPEGLPSTISITEVEGHAAKSSAVPTETFLNVAPAQGEDVERVSTGTKFALRMWLNTLAEGK